MKFPGGYLWLFLFLLLTQGCPAPGKAGPLEETPPAPPPPVLTEKAWWGLWEVAQDGYTVQWFFGSRRGFPLNLSGEEVQSLAPLEFLSFNGTELTAREVVRGTGALVGDVWHFQKISPRRLLRTYRDPVTGETRDSGNLGFVKGRTGDGTLTGTLKALLGSGAGQTRGLDLSSLTDIKVLVRDLKDDLAEEVILPQADGTFAVPDVVPEAPVVLEVTGVPEGSSGDESLMEVQAVPLTGDFDAGVFTVPPPEEERRVKVRLVPVYSHPVTGDATEDVRLMQFPLSAAGSRPRWNLWLESVMVPAQTVAGPLTVTAESPGGYNFLGFFIKGNNTAVQGNQVTFGSAGPAGSGARAELIFDPPDFTGDYQDFPLEFKINLPGQAEPFTDRISVRIWKTLLPIKILSDRAVTAVYTSPEGSTRTLSGTGTGYRVFRIQVPRSFTGGFQTLALYSASGAKISLGLGTDTISQADLQASAPSNGEEPNDTEVQAKKLSLDQTYLFSLTPGDWDYFTW